MATWPADATMCLVARTLLCGSEVIPSRYVAAYDRPVVDPQHRGPFVITCGAITTVVGTFMPWLRSGARNRSSYTIFDLVERLGFAPGGVVEWSLRLWPIVPLLLVLVTTGSWMVAAGRVTRRVLVPAVALAVLWIGGTAVAVLVAPDVALFRVGPGPPVTIVGVTAMAAGAIWISRPRSGSSAAA